MADHTSKGTALITGASSGIGAVYADRFAKRGFDLILVARNQKRLGDLSAQLALKYNRRVDIISADLTSKDDLKKIEDRLRTDTSITTLVNNAGFGAAAGVLDSKIDDLEGMIFLNVTALTRLAAAALPGFIQRGHGVVINIASIVALVTAVGNSRLTLCAA
jgi:short-subunit dehydrogenase